jgi:hypothetical protein
MEAHKEHTTAEIHNIYWRECYPILRVRCKYSVNETKNILTDI